MGHRRGSAAWRLRAAWLAVTFVPSGSLSTSRTAPQRGAGAPRAAAVELELKPRQRSIDVYRTQPTSDDSMLWDQQRESTKHRHIIHLDQPPPIADPFALVKDELQPFGDNIKQLVQSDNPVLSDAAAHFFEKRHGKRFRPTIVALVARALPLAVPAAFSPNATAAAEARALVTGRQARLGQITEMIHVASLIHDDVLDDADTRRGGDAIHKMYSNKVAVLAGDYLLARASVLLAKLQNAEVVEVMARALDSLVSGEIMQIKSTNAAAKKSAADGDETALSPADLAAAQAKPSLYARARDALALGGARRAPAAASPQVREQEAVEMELYLRKSYYKTASLICDACRSCALLAGHVYESPTAAAVEEYGYHLGLAFQIVDDVLDLCVNSEDLGKPAGADLQLGLATAAILYAAREHPTELRPLIDRRFKGDGDVQRAVEIVQASGGLDLARKLARWHAQCAVDAISALPESEARDALVSVCYVVLTRAK
ncbi:isoprenoid synthase domain-containing protein [Pelagophyceae sp. CCMP2097]|nr:isoprenoid synthase domain-containing protein [Pelagophyceae sp. CCMP2097]|mmetsp:Transcript_2470/g.9007  ORF Transcript_2470/g.9007 Transcript_2470/m.9007 type:complete len:488 (+) Transcript_2470:101-1564(+)